MLSGIFQVTRAVASIIEKPISWIIKKRPLNFPLLSPRAHIKNLDPLNFRIILIDRPYHLDFQQFISSNPSPFFLFFPGEYYRVRSRGLTSSSRWVTRFPPSERGPSRTIWSCPDDETRSSYTLPRGNRWWAPMKITVSSLMVNRYALVSSSSPFITPLSQFVSRSRRWKQCVVWGGQEEGVFR